MATEAGHQRLELPYDLSVLRNGVRIASAPVPHAASVSIGVWVGVGGRYEPARVAGISHFIEHLLFKGTKRRSARDISREIEGRGGYFNAFTGEEATCYYAVVPAEHAVRVTGVLADMYLHPRFAAEDIERERGVIIEEIMMYRDQPSHVVLEKLGQMLWSHHPLGRPLIGTPETVRRIRREDLLSFKNTRYVPANTVVVTAGAVRHEQAVAQADRLWGRIRPARRPAFRRVNRTTGQQRAEVIHRDVEQCHLAAGFRVFGRHDMRRYALKLLSVILGENMSSRLFQSIRERRGLAYSIHSSVRLLEETGALLITAGLDRKRALEGWRLIIRELARIIRQPVSRAELARARDYTVGQLKIGLESSSSRMTWIGEQLLAYNRVMDPKEVVEAYSRITPDDIMEVARYCLRSGRLSVAAITPDRDLKADHLMEEVSQIE
ncbi:MAG: insulinase family protein [Verrucomicrobia bacterium]|nr:MAG: insulinase family protein [Verrucomicrobiota bacterium]